MRPTVDSSLGANSWRCADAWSSSGSRARGHGVSRHRRLRTTHRKASIVTSGSNIRWSRASRGPSSAATWTTCTPACRPIACSSPSRPSTPPARSLAPRHLDTWRCTSRQSRLLQRAGRAGRVVSGPGTLLRLRQGRRQQLTREGGAQPPERALGPTRAQEAFEPKPREWWGHESRIHWAWPHGSRYGGESAQGRP